MDFSSVINSMEQQLRVLKDLENLLDHNEKQDQTHSVKPEDIEALRAYVAEMKLAADTATALAKHYKDAGKAQPAGTDAAKPEETKAASRKRQSTKKEEPAPEPPVPPAPEPVGAEPPAEPPMEEPGAVVEDEFDFLN